MISDLLPPVDRTALTAGQRIRYVVAGRLFTATVTSVSLNTNTLIIRLRDGTPVALPIDKAPIFSS